MAMVSKKDQLEAIEYLRSILKPGDTVSTSLVRVSASGMNRKLRVYAVVEGEIRNITYHVHAALSGTYGMDKHNNLSVSGCGMDMGFHVVYSLSYTLFPNGFECIGRDRNDGPWCPSNDHSNGDHDYTPHHHNDGGYALTHRWL